MIDFISEHFIKPIYKGTGYNIYNTIIYGLLLGIGIILADKMLKKLRISINREFYFATIPFLTLASILRALTDAHILPTSFFFITPGIFLTIFLLTFFSLGIALILENKKGIEYHKSFFGFGLGFLAYPLALLLQNIRFWVPLLQIIAVTVVSSLFILFFLRAFKIKSKVISLIYSSHMLDASATFIAIQFYGYWEEHVFENYLIHLANTALVLYPLKILILIIAISLLEKIDENSLWYYAIFLLGYSPGLRDTFKIMLLG